ncbi:tyrosine-type recombinase/integrase [Paenibacillus bouchesdurhonensis]|uniref:tyrosine-type recombinase/integrase n=1 Tax=Paenibacillus bouchesdurhonensis TaxID=1870990 RepID=UPI000DA6091F|nr:tyrosine-type recombinase/integrase [Paenibacillus bouchesdurhonensis]
MDKRVGKNYKFTRSSKAANKPLDDLFDIFYAGKVAEGRSPRTLEMYSEGFRYLTEYMENVGVERTFNAVTPDLLRSYIAWMLHGKRKWEGHAHKSEEDKTVGLSPVTVNTKIKPLKTMFRYLNEEGHIDHDPCARIKKIHEPEKKIRVLTVGELQKLLAAPDRKTYAGFRDYVAMNVLIDSFARIGEILSIKKADIDFKLGMIWFDEKIVKTRKGRAVPVTKRTLRLLKELIKENEDFDTEYVFVTNYGEPIRDDRLRDRLKQHAKAAGLNVRVHPHLFRHTSATMFLEKGGDLRHLASILGHTDLRMVMKYTHLSDRAIKAQHELYSPINDVVKPLNRERKRKRNSK